jgi:predicted nucleic acid-binding protein
MDMLERHFVERVTILSHSEEISREWARLVAICESSGLSVGENDAWIGATAIVDALPLLSNDHIFADIARLYPKLVVVS